MGRLIMHAPLFVFMPQVSATESVVGSLHQENVYERKSRNGTYSSVKIMAYITEGEQVRSVHVRGLTSVSKSWLTSRRGSR